MLADQPEQKPSEPPSHPGSSTQRGVTLLVALCQLLVLMIYVWFVSVGTWTSWPALTTYYDQLATGFSHGQLSLGARPDPALLALPNPYDPASRTGVPFLLDASLYGGKYYLYFGPVPALLLLIFKVLLPHVTGDQYLVFAFIAGIFIVQSLFLLKIRQRFFPALSMGMTALSVLLIGLIGPFTWILGLPTVYNAAIMGGQFFFLAGLYAAFDAFNGASMVRWKLLAAGLFWAAALGTRITQVLPIGFMAILLLLQVATRVRQGEATLSGSVRATLPFCVALGLGVAALGWYNWARFGSVFETGIKYQLAGVALQDYGGKIVSPLYFAQNLYNYLLNPPLLKPAFPFFRPTNGLRTSILGFIQLPKMYWSQQLTGLLYTAPFVLFSIVPAIGAFQAVRVRGPRAQDQRPLRWLIAALCGSFLVGAAYFLFFFWASERYLGDFLPVLMLLAIIGFWQASRAAASRPLGRVIFLLLAFSLIASSVLVSSLLALAINSDGFRQLDPVLWRQLGNLFRP